MLFDHKSAGRSDLYIFLMNCHGFPNKTGALFILGAVWRLDLTNHVACYY
jgi:hypothetical protein